ncbi:MAG: bifunctional folylpolyglutamate synthase/dihydrofolate synthase [Gammaproteobacteria bacterium]|nr:bifunctional folylpolyglutamate synthase/dihydrofolate synthase [Gammaproteobacteria bacterium]
MTIEQQLLDYLEQIRIRHPKAIDLGLARIGEVARRLQLTQFPVPVVMVTGTNGKSSTVAMLEQIYLVAGYRVVSFTSLYLHRINEQIRYQGKGVSSAQLLQQLRQVQAACGEMSLSEFEMMTLAALYGFKVYQPDVVLLEVGMGGREDAVNVVDSDVAVITNIALDHQAWLGETREAIAYHKAGIMRANKPVLCGDRQPPALLKQYAESLQAPFYQLTRDFHAVDAMCHYPDNAALARQAVALLQQQLPVDFDNIAQGLENFTLAGRFEQVSCQPDVIADVAHNPAAAAYLAKLLQTTAADYRHTYAVFSMLSDKEITATIKSVAAAIDYWHVALLSCSRAASREQLQQAFQQAQITTLSYHENMAAALSVATATATKDDRIVVFGSSYAAAMVSS